MEIRGWIEQRREPADRRTDQLFPGARAKLVFAAAARIAEGIEAEALSRAASTGTTALGSGLLRTFDLTISGWSEVLGAARVENRTG
jgi:DNA-binding MarR family transcriptional regulator